MTKERNVALATQCVLCGTTHEVMVDLKDAQEYMSPNRRHVQDIFPYLTPEERELLISGICPVCWELMFACEEDEYIDEDYAPSPEDLKEWQDASCGLV